MPIDERITRRRAITILASAVAGAMATGSRADRLAIEHEWRGLAMGTDARILFSGLDAGQARAVAAAVAAEIERLEGALSLFRADSEICRLNRERVLVSPTGDLRRALALALAVAETTGGLFDPTVQALWETHVDWFAAAPGAGLPPEAVIATARRAVDWRKIALAGAIRLGRGQRITLNGLGQGYVTDRIADLLRQRGFEHVLVDLGEQRALGPRSNGTPWPVTRKSGGPLALSSGALATSEGAGCVIGAGGAAHHLFDPRTGRSAQHWQRVTVYHRSAAVADALSTALFAAGPHEIAGLLARFAGMVVWASDREGRGHRWAASAVTGVAG